MDVIWPLLEGWCNPPSVCCLSWMSIDLSSLSSFFKPCRVTCVSDESQLRGAAGTNQSTACVTPAQIYGWQLASHHAVFLCSLMYSSGWIFKKYIKSKTCMSKMCFLMQCDFLHELWSTQAWNKRQDWRYIIAVWLKGWLTGTFLGFIVFTGCSQTCSCLV